MGRKMKRQSAQESAHLSDQSKEQHSSPQPETSEPPTKSWADWAEESSSTDSDEPLEEVPQLETVEYTAQNQPLEQINKPQQVPWRSNRQHFTTRFPSAKRTSVPFKKDYRTYNRQEKEQRGTSSSSIPGSKNVSWADITRGKTFDETSPTAWPTIGKPGSETAVPTVKRMFNPAKTKTTSYYGTQESIQSSTSIKMPSSILFKETAKEESHHTKSEPVKQVEEFKRIQQMVDIPASTNLIAESSLSRTMEQMPSQAKAENKPVEQAGKQMEIKLETDLDSITTFIKKSLGISTAKVENLSTQSYGHEFQKPFPEPFESNVGLTFDPLGKKSIEHHVAQQDMPQETGSISTTPVEKLSYIPPFRRALEQVSHGTEAKSLGTAGAQERLKKDVDQPTLTALAKSTGADVIRDKSLDSTNSGDQKMEESLSETTSETVDQVAHLTEDKPKEPSDVYKMKLSETEGLPTATSLSSDFELREVLNSSLNSNEPSAQPIFSETTKHNIQSTVISPQLKMDDLNQVSQLASIRRDSPQPAPPTKSSEIDYQGSQSPLLKISMTEKVVPPVPSEVEIIKRIPQSSSSNIEEGKQTVSQTSSPKVSESSTSFTDDHDKQLSQPISAQTKIESQPISPSNFKPAKIIHTTTSFRDIVMGIKEEPRRISKTEEKRNKRKLKKEKRKLLLMKTVEEHSSQETSSDKHSPTGELDSPQTPISPQEEEGDTNDIGMVEEKLEISEFQDIPSNILIQLPVSKLFLSCPSKEVADDLQNCISEYEELYNDSTTSHPFNVVILRNVPQDTTERKLKFKMIGKYEDVPRKIHIINSTGTSQKKNVLLQVSESLLNHIKNSPDISLQPSHHTTIDICTVIDQDDESREIAESQKFQTSQFEKTSQPKKNKNHAKSIQALEIPQPQKITQSSEIRSSQPQKLLQSKEKFLPQRDLELPIIPQVPETFNIQKTLHSQKIHQPTETSPYKKIFQLPDIFKPSSPEKSPTSPEMSRSARRKLHKKKKQEEWDEIVLHSSFTPHTLSNKNKAAGTSSNIDRETKKTLGSQPQQITQSREPMLPEESPEAQTNLVQETLQEDAQTSQLQKIPQFEEISQSEKSIEHEETPRFQEISRFWEFPQNQEAQTPQHQQVPQFEEISQAEGSHKIEEISQVIETPDEPQEISQYQTVLTPESQQISQPEEIFHPQESAKSEGMSQTQQFLQPRKINLHTETEIAESPESFASSKTSNIDSPDESQPVYEISRTVRRKKRQKKKKEVFDEMLTSMWHANPILSQKDKTDKISTKIDESYINESEQAKNNSSQDLDQISETPSDTFALTIGKHRLLIKSGENVLSEQTEQKADDILIKLPNTTLFLKCPSQEIADGIQNCIPQLQELYNESTSSPSHVVIIRDLPSSITERKLKFKLIDKYKDVPRKIQIINSGTTQKNIALLQVSDSLLEIMTNSPDLHLLQGHYTIDICLVINQGDELSTNLQVGESEISSTVDSNTLMELNTDLGELVESRNALNSPSNTRWVKKWKAEFTHWGSIRQMLDSNEDVLSKDGRLVILPRISTDDVFTELQNVVLHPYKFGVKRTTIFPSNVILVDCSTEMEAIKLQDMVTTSEKLFAKLTKGFFYEVWLHSLPLNLTVGELIRTIRIKYRHSPIQVQFRSYKGKSHEQLAKVMVSETLLNLINDSPEIEIQWKGEAFTRLIQVQQCTKCKLFGHRRDICPLPVLGSNF